MDVVQLERFLRIDTVGSFRAASRSLGLSQAALSFSMQQLESELGGPLFERSGSGARLSPLGVSLRARAQLIVAQVERMKEDAQVVLGRGSPHLNFGTTESLAVVAAQATGALLTKIPNLALRLSYADSDALLHQLRTGQLDIVLCSPKSGADISGLEFEPTYELRFVLAARARHPIFRRGRPMTLDDAHEYGWIMHEGASPLAATLDGQLSPHGLERRLRARVPAHALTRSMILATDLLGYLVEDLIRDDLEQGSIRVIDLKEITISARAGLMVRKGDTQSRAATLLCRELRLASRELRRRRPGYR